MHDIPNRIADILLEVEANLRTSGKWDAYQPPQEALISSQPFCFDTLRFEQWLQWIFLPRMKQILELRQPLPRNSGIFAYAQETLHKNDSPAVKLLALIKRFDDLIAIQAGARPH
ncbi:MAG: YqcC family protein [Gammaproteobacteria bacterium]|nr:MAG: YqcC family protein [Gammaproteobacteria bacterium]